MKRFGKSSWRVVVWGDWETIISAREYRDILLEQKPCDEFGAEWGCYRIQCDSADAMVAAFNVFRAMRLRCEFESSFISEDKAVCAEMQTGFDGDGIPSASVGAVFSDNAAETAIRTAMKALESAIA